MKKIEAQASVEFMVLVSILSIILIVVLYGDISIRQKLIFLKSRQEAIDLCDRIAFEINSAAKAGDGYSRRIYIEKNLFGIANFSISIEGYAVIIDWDGKSSICKIITNDVNGNFKKGWNLIKNVNGSIYVT
jgi:hypothetical protein